MKKQKKNQELNEIVNGRYKSEQQEKRALKEMCFKNIIMLYELRGKSF